MSDLFEFFKENEEKLREMPSKAVWEKLETRLESRRMKLERRAKRRRKIRFLQIGLISLILILLLLAAWFVLKAH